MGGIKPPQIPIGPGDTSINPLGLVKSFEGAVGGTWGDKKKKARSVPWEEKTVGSKKNWEKGFSPDLNNPSTKGLVGIGENRGKELMGILKSVIEKAAKNMQRKVVLVWYGEGRGNGKKKDVNVVLAPFENTEGKGCLGVSGGV